MRQRLALITYIILATAFNGCAKKEEGAAKPQRPPVPVVSDVAKTMNFPLEMTQMGTVEAVQSTPVKAQIGGAVVSVLIREGQNVKAGQPLYVIDQRPIEGSIKQLEADRDRFGAQAKLAQAQAKALEAQERTASAQAAAAEAAFNTSETQAALAETQFKRYSTLAEKDFVTREQLDQARASLNASKSNLAAARSQADAAKSAAEGAKANTEAAKASIETARASIAATEAAIENAKVQLGYTTINSPISGQAGSLIVKKGEFVKGNGDTTMVSINQIDPILVRFTVPEPMLSKLQTSRADKDAAVMATLPSGELREGKLVFLDNAVDRATGTIAAKASFKNPDGALWPGQLVNVSITLDTLKNVVVVPSPAVQIGQRGPYSYVIKADTTVEARQVTPGVTRNNLTVVEKGVSSGERVVVDGHIKLMPGAATVEKPRHGTQPQAEAKPAKSQGEAAK